jgi:hypothetical protein
LTLGFLTDLSLEVGIGWNQQSGLPGVNASLIVIDASAEDFWCGKMKLNGSAIHFDIAGLQIREVNSGDDFAVDHHEQAISSKKIREDTVFFGASDHLIHGVDDGFEALQFLDAIDDGGLGYVDVESSSGQARPGMGQQSAAGIAREQ